MQGNYDLLLERISISSGISKEELDRKIEARRAKLSGLISREGAAQIIAAELGVNFENALLKISEMLPGMKKVNFVAKIMNIFPVRSYEKAGKKGKVANLVVADETGNIKLVLWDTNHISLIENGDLKVDDTVEVKNGAMRETEVHLSGFSEIKKSSIVIDNVKTEKTFSERSGDNAQQGSGVVLRGVVVQVFSPRFFSVCSQCNKKVVQDSEGFSCNEHGKVIPKERALLNFVLDDGVEALRTVLFSDTLEKLTSLEKLKDPVAFLEFKESLLGTEFNAKGVMKKNTLFNTLELVCQDLEKVDPQKLIEILEKA